MRRNAIILLLALMAGILPVFTHAQRVLAPSIQQQGIALPEKTAQLFNKAGFDLQNHPKNQLEQPRFNELQLDSTKTFVGYDWSQPGDSTPFSRTVYQYPSSNEEIQIVYQWENEVWLPLNRSTIVRDAQQRITLVSSEAYAPDTHSYVPDSRIESFPHGASMVLLDSFAVYQWNPDVMDWVVQIATINSFNEENKLLESYSVLNFLGEPVIFVDTFLYDANGDNYLIESSGIFEGFEVATGKTENTFLNHLLIAEIDYISDGVNFFPQTRTTFLYAPFGQLARHSSFDWDVAIENWVLDETIDYNYDDAQRLSEEFKTFYEAGTPGNAERISYEYAEGSNLALETILLFDPLSETWSLDRKTHYYYNLPTSIPNEPQLSLPLPLAPNPTSGLVRIGLDEVVGIQLFDQVGKLVTTQTIQPGQMLDISMLPAGIYMITARSEHDFFNGRIVKQ